MPEQRVTREVLPNGLTVLVAEDPASPVVAINLWVRAGYFDETDDQIGISHVIEHMFFKGTTARPRPDQIATEIKSLGGELNAGTYYESTNYYVVLPAENFLQGFAIQADALADPRIDPGELKKEQEAVLQEARRKIDNPTAYAVEMMFREGFDVHRIRRWRIGTEEGIRAMTREHLLEYYRSHYVPERVIVCVVGGVRAETAFDAARRLLGAMPQAAGSPLGSPPEPPQAGFRYRRLTADIRRGHTFLGFKAAPVLSDDDFALRILAHILGGGRASRLHQAVKERDGLVDGIGSGLEAFRDIGMLTVECEGDPKNAVAAQASAQAEIERLRAEPPTPVEIERARTAIEFRYHQSRSEVLGRSSVLAYYESLGGYEQAEESVQRLSRVSAADVRRAAESYLDLSRATLLEYFPEGSLAAPAPAAAARYDELRRIAPGAPLRDPGPTRSQAPVRAAVPQHPARLEGRGSITRHRFDTGTVLVHEERRELPLVTFCLALRGGRSGEQRENCGITRLMQSTILKGTVQRDARRVALEMDGLGTAIERIVDEDYFGFAISILARHARRGFESLMDLLRHPAFVHEELEKERVLLLAAQESIKDQSMAHTFQLFRQAAFGSHPYALPPCGQQASVQGLKRDDLVRWHRLTVRPATLVVTAVGAIGEAELQEMVGGAQADWPQEGYGGSEPGQLLAWGANEVIETRRRTQTAQVIGFPTPGLQGPDRSALDLLQSVTSGLGGRFFEAVRGQRGLAYTVQSFNYHRLRGGAFVIYMATSPKDEAEARRVLFKEIVGLRQTGPRQDEIERARRHLIGSHVIGMQGNAARACRYTDAEVRGLGLDEVIDYPQRLLAVSGQNVHDATWQYLDPDRCAMGILRGESPTSGEPVTGS